MASTLIGAYSHPLHDDPHPIVPGWADRCPGREWLSVRSNRPPTSRGGANYGVMGFFATHNGQNGHMRRFDEPRYHDFLSDILPMAKWRLALDKKSGENQHQTLMGLA